MKKYLFIAMAAVLALAACKKSETPTEKAPEVSIEATAFDANTLKATATITLSKAYTEDVKVTLAKAAVQSGKTEVTATFEKKVTIAKGKTSASVEVIADATGLKNGQYQAAIKISEASGATVSESKNIAYMDLNYSYIPTVNLYKGADFTDSYNGYITLAIDKASSSDVVIKLETAAGGTAPLTYKTPVTIPAGETTVDVDVTVDPSSFVTGNYSSTIQIASIEGGKAGTSASTSMSIDFPLIPVLAIDGDLSDWDAAVTQDVENPAGSMFDRHIKARIAATGSYVYMLYEVKGKKMYGSIMSDVFLDVDGNPATGATFDAQFTPGNTGIEVLLEQCLTVVGGGYANGCGYGLYIHGGANGDPLYSSWATNPPYNDSQIMLWWVDNKLQDDLWSFDTAKDPADGIVRYEAWFNREFFGITGTSMRIGFKSFDWGDGSMGEGWAPQVAKAGDPVYTPCDMFTVHLPAYEAPQPAE